MGILDLLRGVADQADFIPGFDPNKGKRGLISQLLGGGQQVNPSGVPPIVPQGQMNAPGGANPLAKFSEPMGALKRLYTPHRMQRMHDAGHGAFLEQQLNEYNAKRAQEAAKAQQEESNAQFLQNAQAGGFTPEQIARMSIARNAGDTPFGKEVSENFGFNTASEGDLYSSFGSDPLKNEKTATPLTPEEIGFREREVGAKELTAEAAMHRAKNPSSLVTIQDGPPSKDNLTPFQQKQDEYYAQILVDWNTGGGADAAKQMDQLNVVADALESGHDDLTGFLIGITPKWALEGLNPNAVDNQELVEEVVQRNLRVVLGAQFTEKEGERLIARAYNTSLPEHMNAARLRRLVQQVQQRAAALESLNEYTLRNGTSAGWNGSLLTVDQIIAEIEAEGRSQGGPAHGQKRRKYNPETGEFDS